MVQVDKRKLTEVSGRPTQLILLLNKQYVEEIGMSAEDVYVVYDDEEGKIIVTKTLNTIVVVK